MATGTIELHVEGGKKPHKMLVSYSYCPFCGNKYETKDEWKNVPQEDNSQTT